MNKTRRGLVLEGGGAKGAYCLGCLIALHQAGISFDAVAGTSSGSLNAALLAANRLEYGETFWKSLSFRSLFKPTRNALLYALLPLHLLGLFLHRYPVPFSPFFSTRQAPKDGILFIVGCFAFHSAYIGILTIACQLSADRIRFGMAAKLILTMATISLLWATPYIIRAAGYTLFDTTPLRNLIKKTFAGTSFTIPTYTTVAKPKIVFDPDNPGFNHIVHQAGFIRTATHEELYFPIYPRIDNAPFNTVVDALVASTALPFGVFPSVFFESVECIDGAMADNLPIWPLIEYEQCTDIWVIRLRPHLENAVEKNWQIVDRLLRVQELSATDAQAMYKHSMETWRVTERVDETIDPPENVPYKSFPNDVRVTVVAPEHSIGGFFGGTMNFNDRYTRRLLSLGRKDALRAIRGIG